MAVIFETQSTTSTKVFVHYTYHHHASRSQGAIMERLRTHGGTVSITPFFNPSSEILQHLVSNAGAINGQDSRWWSGQKRLGQVLLFASLRCFCLAFSFLKHSRFRGVAIQRRETGCLGVDRGFGQDEIRWAYTHLVARIE